MFDILSRMYKLAHQLIAASFPVVNNVVVTKSVALIASGLAGLERIESFDDDPVDLLVVIQAARAQTANISYTAFSVYPKTKSLLDCYIYLFP